MKKLFALVAVLALVVLAAPAFAQTATPTPTNTPRPLVLYGTTWGGNKMPIVTKANETGTTCVGQNGELRARRDATGGLQACVNGVWYTVPLFSPTPTPTSTPTPTPTPTATPTPTLTPTVTPTP